MSLIKYISILLLFLFGSAIHAEEHISTFEEDITGDSSKEIITYRLNKNGEKYDVSLTIITKDNRVLWSHEYQMKKDDLYDDLLMYEGNISLEHWVKHFFDGSLVYGSKFEKYKIKENEIDMEFLAFYSKKLKHTKEELRDLIQKQNSNRTFYYRASWREELVMLVYIPELKQMLHYSGGEY